MKQPEIEIAYDSPLELDNNFAKEFDGLSQGLQQGIQEVWKPGAAQKNNVGTKVDNMKVNRNL